MVIAVGGARVMQVAVHDVVDVIAVGDRLVLAARPVLVIGRMRAARVRRGACGRIERVDVECMGLDLAASNVVEMSVADVVLMAAMADGRVPASDSVRVKLALMALVVAHERVSLSTKRATPRRR